MLVGEVAGGGDADGDVMVSAAAVGGGDAAAAQAKAVARLRSRRDGDIAVPFDGAHPHACAEGRLNHADGRPPVPIVSPEAPLHGRHRKAYNIGGESRDRR